MNDVQLNALVWFAVFSAAGWVALVKGLRRRRALRDREEREHGRATGTIVEIAQSKKGRAQPVVEFTAEGQSVHREYDNALDPKEFPAGTSVEILYDVNRPERFHLAEDPVFLAPGLGAIRISIIWILASAALTVILAVFVGGARFDLRSLWYDIQRLFRR